MLTEFVKENKIGKNTAQGNSKLSHPMCRLALNIKIKYEKIQRREIEH